MIEINPKIGDVYDFRSGTRLVLTEPTIDIDGVEKVGAVDVRLLYYPVEGSTAAIHVAVNEDGSIFHYGKEYSNWAHTSSISHQWVFTDDKVHRVTYGDKWPGRVDFYRGVTRVFLKSKKAKAA